MPPRVLVVDDSAFMRKVLANIIKSMGWEVVRRPAGRRPYRFAGN
jgi:chemotaxis response regulator CheB